MIKITTSVPVAATAVRTGRGSVANTVTNLFAGPCHERKKKMSEKLSK
jgi:hypothetical protein